MRKKRTARQIAKAKRNYYFKNKTKIDAYQREWRRKNRDRSKIYRERWDPTGEKSKASRLRYYKKNRKKVIATAREWHARNPERFKDIKLKSMYGIDPKVYHAKVKKQKGCCGICKRRPLKKRLCVDHSHTSKIIRDLLCSDCNLILGHCREDIRVLKNAISYLRKHQK